MSFSVADVHSFLVARWSLPLRRACPHPSQQMHRYVAADNPPPTPTWARPLYLQRWLAQALSSRLAWQETQPEMPRYRFERRSEPCWSQTITLPYDARSLHDLDEEQLLRYLDMEVERLYRIARTPQGDVGETLWTLTLLAACRHVGQLYGEMKRRYRAPRARELLWQALRLFVTWRADEAA